MIKVLVCTLENGEAEFLESKSKVEEQLHVEVEHVVISGLTEYWAHAELVRLWNSSRFRYQMLAKVDADSILISPNAFIDVFELIQKHSAMSAQVKMHDFFTQGLVGGMNFYMPEVEFKFAKSSLFSDRIVRDDEHRLIGDSLMSLEPIAYHCKYPSPRQAYAFGFRRMLKKQQDVMRKTAISFLRDPIESRAWAIQGMIDAKESPMSRFFFSSKKLNSHFEQRYFAGPLNLDITRYWAQIFISL
jgi:hypothetical protein